MTRFLMVCFLVLLSSSVFGQGQKGIKNLHNKPLSDFPKFYKSFETEYMQIWWDFSLCGNNDPEACPQIPIEGKVDTGILSVIEQRAAEVTSRAAKKFDSWAMDNLSYWNQRGHEVFPVKVVLNPRQEFDSIAVTMGAVGNPDQFSLPLDQKRPEISIGTKGMENELLIMDESIPHEFGHTLHMDLGTPQYSGFYEEVLADLTHLIINGGVPYFMPSYAEMWRKKVTELISDPLTPDWNRVYLEKNLRISSERGMRDFTHQRNFKYNEVYEVPSSYFASSLINRTFHLLKNDFSFSEIGKVVFEMINDQPEIFASSDLWLFIAEVKRRLELLPGRQVDWNRVNQVLESQGWSPTLDAGESERTFSASIENEKNFGQVVRIKDTTPSGSKLKDRGKKFYVLYAGDKIVMDSICSDEKSCSLVMAMQAVDQCKFLPCKCVDGISQFYLQTIYLDKNSKRVMKSQKTPVSGVRASGCYFFNGSLN